MAPRASSAAAAERLFMRRPPREARGCDCGWDSDSKRTGPSKVPSWANG